MTIDPFISKLDNMNSRRHRSWIGTEKSIWWAKVEEKKHATTRVVKRVTREKQWGGTIRTKKMRSMKRLFSSKEYRHSQWKDWQLISMLIRAKLRSCNNPALTSDREKVISVKIILNRQGRRLPTHFQVFQHGFASQFLTPNLPDYGWDMWHGGNNS